MYKGLVGQLVRKWQPESKGSAQQGVVEVVALRGVLGEAKIVIHFSVKGTFNDLLFELSE